MHVRSHPSHRPTAALAAAGVEGFAPQLFNNSNLGPWGPLPVCGKESVAARKLHRAPSALNAVATQQLPYSDNKPIRDC